MNTTIAECQVDFFLPVVREVLDPRLAKCGFAYAGDHRGVTAYWSSGDRFFRVGYLPETIPRYELLLGVGETEGPLLKPKSSANSVGVWRLLPADTAPGAGWWFDGPRRLTTELRRVWDQSVVPFVLPVLNDPGALTQIISEHADEITRDDERRMQQRLLDYARAAFDAGRFADASHAYDEVKDDALTRADRKRAEIARERRRFGPG